MTTREAEHYEIDPGTIGRLQLEDGAVPYVDLVAAPFIHSRLRAGDVEYVYERSFPARGHSAVLPEAVRELREKDKRFLVAERGDRYYIYVA